MLLKLVSLFWLLPRSPVGSLLCAVLLCRGRRRHINAEVRLIVEKSGGSVSVAFSFFVNFREVLAATRLEILQVRVLEPLREPAFLVSS